MSSKEYNQDIGFQQEKKHSVHDVSLLDPKFREVFDTFPWVAEDLQLLREKSPWKFDHTIRVGQIGLALARQENLSEQEESLLTVASMLHDVAMVDDDMVDLTNSLVGLEGEPLRFLIEEHPRRAAERYASRHPEAALLIGAHSHKPSEILMPETLRTLQACLYFSDQVDARMSDRPYRTVAETQTAQEVLTDLAGENAESILQTAIATHAQLYRGTAPLSQAA